MEIKSTMPLYPDFIICGFPKCGTTALHANLSKNTMVHMADPYNNSEVDFFRYSKSLNWYSSLFVEGKVNGEKSSCYIHSKKALDRIKKDIPNVKLIICIRHPVMQVQSLFNYHNFKFDFDKFKNGMTHNGLSIKDSIYYNYIINVTNNFPPRQILFVVNERFIQNLNSEWNNVCKFLSVSTEVLANPKKKTGNHYQKTLKVNYNENLIYDKITKQIGEKEYFKCIKYLRDYYKIGTENLKKLLNDPLPEWDVIDSKYDNLLS